MTEETIVHISYFTKWSEVSDVIEKGRIEYMPAIAYTMQRDGSESLSPPELVCVEKPFSLLEMGLSIEMLCRYAKDELAKKDELKVARKAYLKLRAFANRCAERIQADLTCALLLKTWDPNKKCIYFLEGPPNDKMLGRLGYLYPSLNNLTICFISFKPEDLITSIMSFQTGRLQFDIHRLMSEEVTGFQGPYPGNSDRSLTQTYFYRHPDVKPGIHVSPLRIDVFTQGLLESEFDEKQESVREILEDDAWVSPYLVDEPVETILPKGLISVLDAWKIQYDAHLDRMMKQATEKESELHV